MGAFVGLVAGIGLLLITRAGSPRARRVPRRSRHAVGELLARAGYDGMTAGQLYAASAALATVIFVVVAGVSRTVSIALAFATFGGYLPIALVRRRAAQRTTERRALWPEVVDNLASGVRAGMSLPEAVSQLSRRGPESLRPAFAGFATDYRATGRFGDCLDRLKAGLADPVADRIVESLRIARDVGGTDLGRLLRTLAQFLRDDARTRAELETRQGWTVGAARLALAAPWAVLAMLSLRPDTVTAYDSAAGIAVLAVGAVVSLLSYRVMLRIARLPDDPRVLG